MLQLLVMCFGWRTNRVLGVRLGRSLALPVARSLVAMLIGACLCSVAFSQKTTADVGQSAPAKDASKSSYGRDIKFEMTDEAVPVVLFDADPDLLEYRYVARIPMMIPYVEDPNRPQDRPSSSFLFYNVRRPGTTNRDRMRDLDIASREILAGALGGPTAFFPTWAVVNTLVAIAPSSQLPSEQLTSRLLSSWNGKVQTTFNQYKEPLTGTDGRDFIGTREFQILAKSDEEAKDLALAFLSLCDTGFFKPMQDLHLNEVNRTKQTLERHEENLAAALNEKKQLDEKLEKTTDVSPEALPSLKSQQWMVEVDLAGVKERIKACETKLRGDPLPPSLIGQLYELKITAEVELAGLEARRTALKEIVDSGVERVAIEKQLLELTDTSTTSARSSTPKGRIPNSEYFIARYKTTIARHEELISLLAPFPIENNTVTIAPVKWEKKAD